MSLQRRRELSRLSKTDLITAVIEREAEVRDRIAPEDGLTLVELGDAMLSASDMWDGDESMHSIVLRFMEHYAELDAEITAAREEVDFDDEVEVLFRWDWEAGTLVRVASRQCQVEPDAEIAPSSEVE